MKLPRINSRRRLHRVEPGARRPTRIGPATVTAILTNDVWNHIYNRHISSDCPRNPGDSCFLQSTTRQELLGYIQQVVDAAESNNWLPGVNTTAPFWGEAGEEGEIIGTNRQTQITVAGTRRMPQAGQDQLVVVTAYPRG